MADNLTKEATEESFQSFAEFLESSPPNQLVSISDLIAYKWIGARNTKVLKTPEIQLHCTDDSCNGVRFHRCVSGSNIVLEPGKSTSIYLVYKCANCQRSSKTFAIRAERNSGGDEFAAEDTGTLYKFGEVPVFGPPTPARLLKLIGPDREVFLKGRRCENQGLGVGAFVYYRRVVENQKNRILSEITKVLERLGSSQENLDTLKKAIEETQFSKALEIAKPAIPESLLINGHNPLKLLHGALSDGIHNLSDEDCLSYASSVRIVLGELSDRLSQALKDEAELSHAISRLLAPRPNKP